MDETCNFTESVSASVDCRATLIVECVCGGFGEVTSLWSAYFCVLWLCERLVYMFTVEETKIKAKLSG
jgi:hypothetical protein